MSTTPETRTSPAPGTVVRTRILPSTCHGSAWSERCISIAALVTHRFAEINQFVQLSGATTCVYPERQGDFEFEPMIRRVQAENPRLKHCISLPKLRQ